VRQHARPARTPARRAHSDIIAISPSGEMPERLLSQRSGGSAFTALVAARPRIDPSGTDLSDAVPLLSARSARRVAYALCVTAALSPAA
jgi:hypothetical protein